MTIAEIDRWMNGATWRLRTKAQYDYILSDLIGVSVSRVMSSEVKLPSIDKVYPELFKDVVEEKEEPEDDLTTKSVNRFLARAMAINAARRHSEEDSGGE